MRRKLTDIVVNQTKPHPDRVKEVWDQSLPGFGLRIMPSGVRTYFVMYRVNGKQKRKSLGRVGVVGLGDARDAAREVMRQVEKGVDPDVATARDGPFRATVERYLADVAPSVKPKTLSGYRRLLEMGPIAAWGDRSVGAITRADVRLMLDEVKKGAPIGVNRTKTATETFFNWCLKRDIVDASPVAGIDKVVKERSRTRVLSEDEVKWLWQAATEAGAPFGDLVKFLLVTGVRRDEAGLMTWGEVNLKKRTWTIPGDRTKNGEPHEVALSDLAVALLGDPGDGYVFSMSGGKTAFNGYSKSTDRLRESVSRRSGKKPAHWTLHDLRRTVATFLAKRGVEERVIKAVLNHTPGRSSGVTAIYNRHRYDEEARAALLEWSAYLSTIVAPKGRAAVA
jgi:integrase